MAADLRRFDLPLGRQPLEVRRLRREWEGHAVSPISGAVWGFTADGQAAVTAVGTVLRNTLNAYRMASVAAGTNLLRAPISRSTIGTDGQSGAACLVQFRTTTTTTSVFLGGLGSDSGSSGNTIFAFSTGVNAAAQLRTTVGNASNYTALEFVGSTVINDGLIHTALVSLDAFNTSGSCTYNIYLDGVHMVEQTDAVVLGSSHVYNWVTAGSVRRTTDLAVSATCDVALAVGFRRRVSRDQGVALTRDPWGELFESRRIWVPVSAGGAVPTISALSARLITSTSAQPRISYS